jgi:hypothetical protein
MSLLEISRLSAIRHDSERNEQIPTHFDIRALYDNFSVNDFDSYPAQ